LNASFIFSWTVQYKSQVVVSDLLPNPNLSENWMVSKLSRCWRSRWWG